MGVGYKHPRGTRSSLNSLRNSNGLVVGQIYALTDENRLCFATAVNAYVDVPKPDEALIPFVVAVSDETTALTTGAAKVTFRSPFACTLVDIRGSLTTAGTGSSTIVNVKEGGTTIFGANKLIIAASAKTSVGGTAPSLSDTALADDAEMVIDLDQVGTGAKGLKVLFMLRRTA